MSPKKFEDDAGEEKTQAESCAWPRTRHPVPIDESVPWEGAEAEMDPST